MQTTEPVTIEDAADSLLMPIEQETEAETDGETQEDETEAVEAETESDASEDVEDEKDEDEVEASDEDDEAESDEIPDDDSSDGDPLETVKVNGEERKVTKQELKNDYAGRAALQQRHEQLKAQEQQIQQAAQTMQQERDRLLQFAQQVQDNGFIAPPKEPDPAQMQTDPLGYMEAEATYRQQMKVHEQQQEQIQQMQQQRQAAMDQHRAQVLAQQREILLQELPELSDPEKGKDVQRALVETAKSYQFTDEEIGGIEDARTIKLLNDARKWREVQAGKQAAKQPKQESKPVTRPKAKLRDGGKQSMAKKKLEQARRTQSTEDWAEAILE